MKTILTPTGMPIVPELRKRLFIFFSLFRSKPQDNFINKHNDTLPGIENNFVQFTGSEKNSEDHEEDNSIPGEFPKHSCDDISGTDSLMNYFRILDKQRGGDPVLIGDMMKYNRKDQNLSNSVLKN